MLLKLPRPLYFVRATELIIIIEVVKKMSLLDIVKKKRSSSEETIMRSKITRLEIFK